jgi:acetyl-CoA carboxylase biotin carboxyl carrier protein
MDLDLVKKIIKIAEESDISGLSVEEGDLKIEVKREKNIVPMQQAAHLPHTPSAPAGSPVKTDEDEGLTPITAPMVGTFYKSPSPDSAPYVEVGDRVEPGKVICIIEAMKLFNEIESEIKGEVVKILVENGKPVEYGQKLYLIRKG